MKQFNGSVFRGYDTANGKPKQAFAAESFSLAKKRLTKKKKNPKRKLKGGQKTFAKRKKTTTELLYKIEE